VFVLVVLFWLCYGRPCLDGILDICTQLCAVLGTRPRSEQNPIYPTASHTEIRTPPTPAASASRTSRRPTAAWAVPACPKHATIETRLATIGWGSCNHRLEACNHRFWVLQPSFGGMQPSIGGVATIESRHATLPTRHATIEPKHASLEIEAVATASRSCCPPRGLHDTPAPRRVVPVARLRAT
jgi:hypothetical protein